MNNSSLFRLRPIQRVKAFRLSGMRIKVVPRVSRPFGGEALAFSLINMNYLPGS